MMRALAALLLPAIALSGIAGAADQTGITKAALARLSEEADTFRQIAPSLIANETLQQKAKKPAPVHFRPRIGQAAKTGPPPVWQERQIVSDYAFVEFAGETETLHEIRRVLSVDGHALAPKKDEESLARIISMKDDQREKELLKEFEKYGLAGAVTDFGPLLMLFTPSEIEHYEFSFRGPQTLDGTAALVFRYTQIDGPELLTIFDGASKGQPRKTRVQGEVWVRQDNYLPLRITLAAGDGQGAAAVREEATVDYISSPFNVLVPSRVDHKELLGGQLSVENSFAYKDFHRFAADSEINFNAP